MDDRTRNDLLATLADARQREAHARERLQARAADVQEARAEHGNPYFFSARAADDPESQAHFTGYKSHEPAFALWREWQDASQQIASISRRLQSAGIDPA